MATCGLVSSGASSESSAPREFWRDIALSAEATSPAVSAVCVAASKQMMVFSFRAARFEVEVEVDLAGRLVRGLRGLSAAGGRLVVMREVRPLDVPVAASLLPTDLVRLREGRDASSSAASCSFHLALISLARRRGSVAYMSSVFLLSRVSVPPSLPAVLPSLASPGTSFTRRRRPKLPNLSAGSAGVVSLSVRVSFLRAGAVLGRPSASGFFLRPRVLVRPSSRPSPALVRVWAWV